MKNLLEKYFYPNLIAIAWLIALGATLGSLVLSHLLGWIPCTLCWYQRIAIFPMAVILGVAVYRSDKNVPYYILPLGIIGAIIALYHSMLQWGLVQETAATCSIDTSCADPEINWLGFITLPFISFLSFMAINILMWMSLRRQK